MWKNVLRWIGVLPLSIVGGTVASFAILHMLRIAWGMHGKPLFFRELIQEILMYAFFAVGFIYSGEKVAPNYKLRTVYFLSAMICMFSLINIVVYTMDSEFFSIATASNATSLVVAILIILYKHEENRQWQD